MDNKLEELARKFAEKNPSLLRDMMEPHFVRFKMLEFSQGKMIGGELENKKYKEIK